MENKDQYITGKGLFGGPGGTYGRYGKAITSSLSSQFSGAEKVEEKQRRRFNRKRETGFVGNGYWYARYPNMVGTMGNPPLERERKSTKKVTKGKGKSAAAVDGMGVGGTGAGYVGGLGS
jgi:hypothetical protein